MTKTQHILSSGTRLRAAGACLVVFLMAFPVRGFAQCEANNAAMNYATGVAGPTQDQAIVDMTRDSMTTKPMPGWDEIGWIADLQPMRATLNKVNRDDVMFNLNTWWARWGGRPPDCDNPDFTKRKGAWECWGRQVLAGILDESRQQGSITDATNEQNAAIDEQEERIRSGFNNQPTDQTCRFDTTAYSLSPARSLSYALQEGYEADFTAFGNNEKAKEKEQSIAQYGPAEMQNQLWSSYVANFCDYLAENGNAGCKPDPLPPNFAVPPAGTVDPNMQQYADMDALPTTLLFAQDTINMRATTSLLAANQMIFNVTGYRIPDPILTGALGSVSGVEHTLDRRRYMTQMDTAAALLYSLIADRAPSPSPAPDACVSPTDGKIGSCIYALRQYLGVVPFVQHYINAYQVGDVPPPFLLSANINPSLREIRASVVEQLWDPNYYKNLYDNPATVGQKEVYLKAYGLMMLYEMIEKQEKISNAYAVETANVLRHSAKILESASTNVPLQ
jgi:hypothetical protein